MKISKFLTVTSPQYGDITALMLESLESVGLDVPLTVEYCADYGSPDFGTPSFNKTTKFKAGKIARHLNEMRDGELLLFADSDVLFFANPGVFADAVDPNNDIIFQNDLDDIYCSGFFVAKKSDKMVELWKDVERIQTENSNDQHVLNKIIHEHGLNVAFFDKSEVSSYGLISGGKQWNGEDFEMPKCLAFHANYTIGIENKKKLMQIAMGKNQSQ